MGILGYFDVPFGIVMNLYQGNLESHILDSSADLTVGDAFKIASDLAHAMEHIHRIGIVHFAINPRSILVNDHAGVYQCALGGFGVRIKIVYDIPLISLLQSSKLIGSDMMHLKMVKGLESPDGGKGVLRIGYCAPEVTIRCASAILDDILDLIDHK